MLEKRPRLKAFFKRYDFSSHQMVFGNKVVLTIGVLKIYFKSLEMRACNFT